MKARSSEIETSERTHPVLDCEVVNPNCTIGTVSRILNLCTDTLRIWEKKGLIKPRREGKNRIYSRSDIDRLRTIKELIHEQGLNVAGVKKVLGTEAG